MSIKEALSKVKEDLPANVKLIAVSKTKPNEAIMDAYESGQRAFGENKVQDLVEKYETLPKDIEWHMIGHLQRNKVKYIVPFVSLIHGVDSFRLLKEINKEAAKSDRKVDCLLQFHIAEESTKFGLNSEETEEMLNANDFKKLGHVNVVGLMGMGTFTDDKTQIHREFKQLKNHFDKLKQQFFTKSCSFKEISMGMSGDYTIAIEEGSTMVRVGSLIFGERY